MASASSFRPQRWVALGLLLAISGAAGAHPGHGLAPGAGFAAGLAHPFTGLDHLLAMLAVGLWSAAALPAGRRWLGPATFVATMTVGAAMARFGVPFGGHLELLIAASVAVLGTMLALGARVAPVAGLALTAAAALLHGAAHGLEMAGSGSFGAYAAGFVAATAALHAAGAGAGIALAPRRAALLRGAGALIGVAGTLLLVARV